MYEVVGIQAYSKKRADGSVSTGTILHLAFEDKNIQGIGVEQVFCNHKYVDVPALQLKDKVELRYNRYGKIASVDKV